MSCRDSGEPWYMYEQFKFFFWALHGTIQAGLLFTSVGTILIYCVEWGVRLT